MRVRLRQDASTSAMQVALEALGREHPERYVARVGEKELEIEIESVASGEGRFRRHGSVLPFHFVKADGALHVWVLGRAYRMEVVDDAPRRGAAAAAHGVVETLTAPMPGTILETRVVAGAVFAAHQPLIVMESMKMEMTLSVPTSGRVEQVLCAAKQLVALGQVLARLSPPPE